MIGNMAFLVWFIICVVIFFCLLELYPKIKNRKSFIAQIIEVITVILFYVTPFGLIIVLILFGLGI